MDDRITFHIVGGNSRSRAEQSRLILSLGHHAEVYGDLEELIDRPPRDGLIIACLDLLPDTLNVVMTKLVARGVWAPLVAARTEPQIHEIVEAIRNGAMDFLKLPLDVGEIRRALSQLSSDAGRHADARRRLIDARQRISNLSPRESEVLDWLAEGCSNKAISRELGISPRTVEIHRANMMQKLGANHSAEAVRLRLDSGLPLQVSLASRG